MLPLSKGSQVLRLSKDSQVLPLSQDSKVLLLSQDSQVLPPSKDSQVLPLSKDSLVLLPSQGSLAVLLNQASPVLPLRPVSKAPPVDQTSLQVAGPEVLAQDSRMTMEATTTATSRLSQENLTATTPSTRASLKRHSVVKTSSTLVITRMLRPAARCSTSAATTRRTISSARTARSSVKSSSCAFGGISSTATVHQDCIISTPNCTITLSWVDDQPVAECPFRWVLVDPLHSQDKEDNLDQA